MHRYSNSSVSKLLFYNRRFIATSTGNYKAEFIKHFSLSKVQNESPLLKGKATKAVYSYLEQLNQDPRTARPSHYNREAQNDPNNLYRKRPAEEYDDPEVSPYQHNGYVPPNDTTTELYKNFRDSGHLSSTVALRERPPRKFIPGAANPYLRSHGRYYSNHYMRLAPDSENPEAYSTYAIYMFIIIGVIEKVSPAYALYTGPEYGGQFPWGN